MSACYRPSWYSPQRRVGTCSAPTPCWACREGERAYQAARVRDDAHRARQAARARARRAAQRQVTA